MIYIILVDIFNSDFCTPALSGDNNIIFKDRKTDIYTNKITLCKDSYEYKSVNKELFVNVISILIKKIIQIMTQMCKKIMGIFLIILKII